MKTSTNLDRLREEFEKSKNGGSQFWKPREYGKYTVRFLPQQGEDSIFYKETKKHKIGDQYLYCPRVEGDSCPICKKYKALWEKNTTTSQALAKEIKPRFQYLYNIILKDENGKQPEDPKKVLIYESGKKLYEKLMSYFFDPDFGDLTDAKSGFNFVIEKSEGDMGFPSYDNSRPKRNPSPISDDEEVIEEILSKVINLDSQVTYKSYEELEKILAKYFKEEVTSSSEKTSFQKTKEDNEEKEEEEEVKEKEEDISKFKEKLLKDLDIY